VHKALAVERVASGRPGKVKLDKEEFTRPTKLVTGSESTRIEEECKKVAEENSSSK